MIPICWHYTAFGTFGTSGRWDWREQVADPGEHWPEQEDCREEQPIGWDVPWFCWF